MTTFTTEDRINAMSDLEPIPFAGLVDLSKPEMSRQDIADVLGMSRQNVGHIEEKALKKLRAELFKRGIEKEDLL
jgi:DNA-directed RNA polymerase specialized sigma24 family protein